MPGKKQPTKKTVKKRLKRKKKISAHDKQFYWVLGIMVGIIVVFLGALYLFSHLGGNTFTYKTLTFTKEHYGKIPVYHYHYSFPNKYGGTIVYNLYLREDPRQNNVSVTGNQIFFPQGKTVYLGLYATNLSKCKDNLRDLGTLVAFLIGNQMNVSSGAGDQYDAGMLNTSYVTCSQHPSNQVIIVKTGNQSSINVRGLCTTITVGNCDTLSPIEKFEVQSILDAKFSEQNITASNA